MSKSGGRTFDSRRPLPAPLLVDRAALRAEEPLMRRRLLFVCIDDLIGLSASVRSGGGRTCLDLGSLPVGIREGSVGSFERERTVDLIYLLPARLRQGLALNQSGPDTNRALHVTGAGSEGRNRWCGRRFSWS